MNSPVEAAAALTVGTVESVAPDEIRVLLELDAPQTVALNAGFPTRFPRLGGYILIPVEVGALVGVVSWLGVERSPYPKRTGLRDFGLVDLPFPLRKLAVVPLGTLASGGRGEYVLRRGVASFPSVGDPALLPTADQLNALVEAHGPDRRVHIGRSPLGADAAVHVDPDKLFGRHLAVLRNTGSGKSCSVAGFIRWSLEAASAEHETSRPNARFIVLDPNGEYRQTFDDLDDVRVFSVEPIEGAQPLRVPAWMWNSAEWAAFTQASPGTQRPLLMQALRNLRGGSASTPGPETRLAGQVRGLRDMLATKYNAGPSAHSGEFGPRKSCGDLLTLIEGEIGRFAELVPAASEEIRALADEAGRLAVEKRFEWRNGVGYNDFGASELEAVIDLADKLLARLPVPQVVGGPNEDAPLRFELSDVAGQLEALTTTTEFSASAGYVETLMLRVRAMLADTRLRPVLAPEESDDLATWLTDFIGDDNAKNGPLTIVDLSLVPADVLQTVVAVIARVVFESLQRYRKQTGSELPTVLVLEEAHSFVMRAGREEAAGPTTPARMCRETFERIAREGRKFGLGLVLSSQRPAELSQTVLAQCNTFLLHRLVNDHDQDLVRRLVPDNLGGLLRELPSLPSQQAILLGWASPLPVMVQMRDLRPEHRPKSADPTYWEVWTGAAERRISWPAVAADWTGTEPVGADRGEDSADADASDGTASG